MIPVSHSAAVVTAAGYSSRMGLPKSLLDWNGVPLLQHQLDQLADWGSVVLVLGHGAATIRRQVRLPHNTEVVVNPDYAKGRVSSLKAGFAALPLDLAAVLVVGVYQPLDATTLDRLVSTMTDEDAIVVPVSEGQRGHPVLFSGRLLAELTEIREETEGLRAVLRRHPVTEVMTSGPFWDLNSPEDYLQSREALRCGAMITQRAPLLVAAAEPSPLG